MQKQTIVKQLIEQNMSISRFTEEMVQYGVMVVQPGTYVSAVFYTGERRFFPRVNEHDIVVGGYFG